MAAHTQRFEHHRRHASGGGVMALVVGVLVIAALGVAWMAWSGGWFAADPAAMSLDLTIPESPNLPRPAPMPEPQPVPLPTPVAPPR